VHFRNIYSHIRASSDAQTLSVANVAESAAPEIVA
jgi:hypothetical protein